MVCCGFLQAMQRITGGVLWIPHGEHANTDGHIAISHSKEAISEGESWISGRHKVIPEECMFGFE